MADLCRAVWKNHFGTNICKVPNAWSRDPRTIYSVFRGTTNNHRFRMQDGEKEERLVLMHVQC